MGADWVVYGSAASVLSLWEVKFTIEKHKYGEIMRKCDSSRLNLEALKTQMKSLDVEAH
jgi:hypothetical protein